MKFFPETTKDQKVAIISQTSKNHMKVSFAIHDSENLNKRYQPRGWGDASSTLPRI